MQTVMPIAGISIAAVILWFSIGYYVMRVVFIEILRKPIQLEDLKVFFIFIGGVISLIIFVGFIIWAFCVFFKNELMPDEV